eukprot:GILI01020503.1.p1 GENE.GILI01020503.1~~GILI01020503.1.p1  ORF type:complete len:198 (+),score=32.67 GILI01020503.1:87-680(+)
MGKYSITDEAYSKIVFHACKFPCREVNGILLGRVEKEGISVENSVPLFHVHTLAPALETAFLLVEELCKTNEQEIVGYYHANENNLETGLNHLAQKVGERIASNNNSACVMLVDAAKLEKLTSESVLNVYGWDRSTSSFKLASSSDVTVDVNFDNLSQNLSRGLYNSLVDFDEHLDDISLDFLNTGLFATAANRVHV